MDVFSKISTLPKKHHRCVSLESGQNLTKKCYPKTPLDLPRFFPRRYSTPELVMRKHALKYLRDDNEQPISNKSCQTDILGLDKYLQRSPLKDPVTGRSAAAVRSYKKPSKKPKVRSVAVHCERRRLSFSAFKGCQKFKHVYKRKISLSQPSSTTTTPDDSQRDRNVLPKLQRPDRTETVERPGAACRASQILKLPRISITKDAEPGRTCEGGGGEIKLAKLQKTRPQSTGSGSASGSDRKLSFFRVRSAPKIDSRYYTLVTAPLQVPEREQSPTTPGSSDTADTALDVSFDRQQQPDNTCTTTAAATATTRTVSTSTTFVEPVAFPIVFSCESVLRHPLDGGYMSHTESHRFSVHYVPVEEAKSTTTTAAATTDTEDGIRSSLTFTSAGACQNERCPTADSISFTVCSKPEDSVLSQCTAPSTSTSDTISEQHPNGNLRFDKVACNDGTQEKSIIDQSQPIVSESSSSSSLDRYSTVDENRDSANTIIDDDKMGKNDYNISVKPDFHVSGNEKEVDRHVSAFVKAIPTPTIANKNFDTFGGDGEDGTMLESHAHTKDNMTLQFNERNYDRLTQNHLVLDLGRTVSNQSPKLDCTTTQIDAIEQQDDLKPVENGLHASEVDLSSNVVNCTEKSTDRLHDEPTQKPIDNNHLIDPTSDWSYINTDMPARGRNRCCTEMTEKRRFEHNNNNRKPVFPNRLYDDINRKRDEKSKIGNPYCNNLSTSHSNAATINHVSYKDKRIDENAARGIRRDLNPPRTLNISINKPTPQDSINNQYYGPFGKRVNELDCSCNKHFGRTENIVATDSCEFDGRRYDTMDSRQRGNSHVQQAKEDDTNTCHCRCTNSRPPYKKNEVKNYANNHSNTKISVDSGNCDCKNSHNNNNGRNQYSKPKRPLESVDESTEAKESNGNNYIGGFMFGDSSYKKKSQTNDADNDCNSELCSGYECYDNSRKVFFSSKSNNNDHYDYYLDYASKTRHSPKDDDCTVFADMTRNRDNKRPVQSKQNSHDVTGVETQTPYYSNLDDKMLYGDDQKNTDSDESLTDSLEDCCKYEGGSAVSYFLALSGQQSAVTFTLKMPNTLQSRLNRRQSQLKKHLHVTTTTKKISTRIRTRHKSCQTLWTVEKGVQVQRGSTASTIRRPAVDDHRVLETLLAGLNRNRVSENQIRVAGGQKMVSEGNQTEQIPDPPTDRQTQTQKTKDVAAGTDTSERNAGTVGKGKHKGQTHVVKKISSDNALMVGVVKQNKYKGKEAVDAKNDQLLTLSKGWINFYTLRSDSTDTDAQEFHDNDNDVKTEDDTQQYTVHVQAIPEPVTLPPVVHVPNRTTLQLPKMTCSAAAKHLPKLVQTETNNHHCSSHLATANGWCVSVDGPNNMHMKVSLLPDKSDTKNAENFDPNEENCKQESKRLVLPRKNNFIRKPYKNIKRTQSTPRDMFSADVSRTESVLSAESKYIETIDTQLLIHKARRRLSQEWDSRIQNRDVTESVQLVVTGDSVSSRTSHYATKGHQHCSFRRQSRRI